MDSYVLNHIAKALVGPSVGILAADESTGTIGKRFQAIGVQSTEENRRNYREMLVATEGISQYISGVILYDETIKQSSSEGLRLVDVIISKGLIPGIKVDTGAKPLAGTKDELVTEGLDGLRQRLAEYRELGARFTKWRAVITIGNDIPSSYCIHVNAHALGRFAALTQEAGMVPIVEPEVLMDGTHSIDVCHDVTRTTLKQVFYELNSQGVDLTGMLLKPNMILPGKAGSIKAEPSEIAERTIDCFQDSIPESVPGIVFLSGGQSDDEATANLDAINRKAQEIGVSWELSFSYGRGLQSAPLEIWKGDNVNRSRAQQAFYNRAYLTSAARQGKYDKVMETNLLEI
ncbi:fructose-bisphosphate aldolase class I [SAR202 cluster bacterium AC-409-J13_OGT_754m]|nr:fructose-bisphosphate aldolase class I [SAR202 cluster bacterium AC-409-J13_OGT_754m]